MPVKLNLPNRIKRRMAELKERAYVKKTFRHISGQTRFKLHNNEAVAIILGRNTEFYIPSLFEWHRSLGVEKFIYVDNGSWDKSIELAASQKNTIVASTNANFRLYQRWIRFYAATLYATGGWRLVLDGDELFDYPNSRNFPMTSLLTELEKRNRTAVVAQMLDMIPDGGLSSIDNTNYNSAMRSCSLYDTSDIEKLDYHNSEFKLHHYFNKNSIHNHSIKIYVGGIRKRLFGERCLLTKHPLFKPSLHTTVLPHPHISCGFTCADFTAVLKHFKFTGNFTERESKLINENRLSHNEAHLRQNVISKNPTIHFRQMSSRVYEGPEKLLDEGFLVASCEMKEALGLNCDMP